jgi:hypothetical protein
LANEQNLIPYKKGQSGNPNGRPKKIENVLKDVFLSEYNVKLSKSQTEEILKNILSKSRSELIELAKNDDLPFWISMIAKKATRDYERGSIHLLELLFDRVYGKPKETVDQNIEAKTINVTLNLENPKGK